MYYTNILMAMTTIIVIGCAVSLSVVITGIFHMPINGSLPLLGSVIFAMGMWRFRKQFE